MDLLCYDNADAVAADFVVPFGWTLLDSIPFGRTQAYRNALLPAKIKARFFVANQNAEVYERLPGQHGVHDGGLPQHPRPLYRLRGADRPARDRPFGRRAD